MDASRVKLGQLLVDAGVLSLEQLEAVLKKQRDDGRRLGTLLVESGAVSETQVTQVLSQQLAVPWVSLYHIAFTRGILSLVPRSIAERYGLVPIYVRKVRGVETLYVAMDDPTDADALAAVAAASGLPARPMIAPPSDIRAAIRAYYGARPSSPRQPAPVAELGEDDIDPQQRATVPTMRAAPRAFVPEPPTDVTAHDSLPPLDPPDDPSEEETTTVPEPPAPASTPTPTAQPPRGVRRRSGPRMLSLTLLDGTTLTLPAPRRRERAAPKIEPIDPPAVTDDAPPTSDPPPDDLTTRDLLAGLRAVAHGADASEVLGDVGWEKMLAALLGVLLRKRIIADWEFIEELQRV